MLCGAERRSSVSAAKGGQEGVRRRGEGRRGVARRRGGGGVERRGGAEEKRGGAEGRRDDVSVSGAQQEGINSTDLQQSPEVLQMYL